MKLSVKNVDATADAMQDKQDKAKTNGKQTSSIRSKSSKTKENDGQPRTKVSFAETPTFEQPSGGRRNKSRRNSKGELSRRNGKENEASSSGRNATKSSLRTGKKVGDSEQKVQTASSSTSNKPGFLRRISGRFTGDKKKDKNSEQIGFDDDDIGGVMVDDDPVISILEARNSQRVRFTLEGAVAERGVPNKQIIKADDQDKQHASTSNIKNFMSRALFGGSSSNSSNNKDKSSKHASNEEIQREAEKEIQGASDSSLVWESAATPVGPEVIHTQNTNCKRSGESLTLSFTEDPKARAQVVKLLKKARRAEHIHFRYEYAVKCYVKALDILTKAKFPDDHPTVQKTMRLLNNSHHVLSSYNNSANIVKMGIKYEDSGELVRALKMYTIAYRIRRDNLSRNHPSLVVLLNMLGTIQIKRGELKEAMQIYELALKDSPVIFSAHNDDDEDEVRPSRGNLLAKSVTYREMGTIYEKWGMVDEALNNYHRSLECVAEWKEAVNGEDTSTSKERNSFKAGSDTVDCSLENVHLARSSLVNGDSNPGDDQGEMELYLLTDANKSTVNVPTRNNMYESLFPAHLDGEMDKNSSNNAKSSRDDYADMDLALTLHQIAQLHRCQGQYAKAIEAYEISLRGMKYALGKHHPNVAAVLGNIGNLQKEMGDMDAAYHTYQEVLGIESYRLGLSHPDVAITLHNIATIDAARGNYEHSLTLYRKVLGLQKKLFGVDHLSVAVTAACMGDVYERIGELKNAMESFEDAVKIKSAALGRHSLEVARLLHKLGKLAFARVDYLMAESFISRAVLIYRLHKLDDEHEWIVDAYRDTADIDGAIAMGGGRQFEC